LKAGLIFSFWKKVGPSYAHAHYPTAVLLETIQKRYGFECATKIEKESANAGDNCFVITHQA